MRKPLVVFAILVLTWTVAGGAWAAASMQVKDLRCEYAKDPLGVEARQPRLSWILTSDQRGQKQTAYQVLVASSASLLKQQMFATRWVLQSLGGLCGVLEDEFQDAEAQGVDDEARVLGLLPVLQIAQVLNELWIIEIP